MNKKFLEILDKASKHIKSFGFKNTDDIINSFFNSQNIDIFCKEIEDLQKNKQKEINELEKKIRNGMDKIELGDVIDKIQKIERYIGTLEGLCITLETIKEKQK